MHIAEDFTRGGVKRINYAPFADKWDVHQSTFMKDNFWTVLRQQVALMEFPSNVKPLYAATSLTLRTKDLKTSVKITSAGEVQVEHKISKIEFKSESKRYNTIKESVDHFVSAAQQHLQISLVS
jgi:hypothetical protein